jgi:hypothetical protein
VWGKGGGRVGGRGGEENNNDGVGDCDNDYREVGEESRKNEKADVIMKCWHVWVDEGDFEQDHIFFKKEILHFRNFK